MFESLARRWKKGAMSEVLIPLTTKVLVSGLLVLLAGIFLWQTWRIWFNRSLVLSPFDYVDDGKPSEESGEQFARMVRADLVQLAGLYDRGEVSNAGAVPVTDPADPTKPKGRDDPLDLPDEFSTSFFESVEIKAYGIEFGSIFKSIRRQIESPAEIAGNVTKQDEKFSVFTELRQHGDGSDGPQRWSINYSKNLPEASRNVACRIFRFLAAHPKRTNRDTGLFVDADEEEFCLFNQALFAYDQYRLRRTVLSDDDAVKLLAEASSPLAALQSRKSVTYPFVHKLTALVLFEQKKYSESERAIERYSQWLASNNRTDRTALELRDAAASQKLQVTPAMSRQRPLVPGISVGPISGKTSGIITGILKDAAGRRYILSATQVLGTVNTEMIVQPAVMHGGLQGDVVAELFKATPTMAVARLLEKIPYGTTILEHGTINGIAKKLDSGDPVITFGLDGKKHEGTVIAVVDSYPLLVDAETGVKESVANAVTTTGIATDKEIGAPVLTPDGMLVGMVIATSATSTLVLPIEPVLTEFGLELMR